jgi:hypothetical protein
MDTKQPENSKVLTITCSQEAAKWSSADIYVPVWLYKEPRKAAPPQFGDYGLFQADSEIDQPNAFKAICSYGIQHLPVGYRPKDVNLMTCYNWLNAGGTLVSGEKQELILKLLAYQPTLKVDILEQSTLAQLRQNCAVFGL